MTVYCMLSSSLSSSSVRSVSPSGHLVPSRFSKHLMTPSSSNPLTPLFTTSPPKIVVVVVVVVVVKIVVVLPDSNILRGSLFQVASGASSSSLSEPLSSPALSLGGNMIKSQLVLSLVLSVSFTRWSSRMSTICRTFNDGAFGPLKISKTRSNW